MTEPAELEGHDKRHCGANKRQGEGTCARPAGWGTDHAGVGRCKLHGGSTPNQSRAAQLVKLESDARILFDKVAPEVVPVTNPLEAYALFAGRVMAWLNLMDSLLTDLDSARYRGATAEQIRGEVVLYERAMDRANAVLSAYARLNIDERLVVIAQKQANMVINGVNAALTYLGVTGDQEREARRIVARHLRAVHQADEGA
jgi:hypothetical protein